jgi:hypothetical protein
MNITICNNEIEYIEQSDTLLFDLRALIKLIWKNQSYYYNKLLKKNPQGLHEVSGTFYVELETLKMFWEDNSPTKELSKAETYDDFCKYGWDKLDELVNPVELIPMVKQDDFDTLTLEFQKVESNLEKLKIKYDKLLEQSKKSTTLRDVLLHPELPLFAQLTTTIVLTFFTWTVFAGYFDFGNFSEYTVFHYVLCLLAAIAFEFGMLVFTVRRDTLWLNVSLLFQFLILGVHSGLLKFEYDSFEDFIIKAVLTITLPTINKAFSSTLFKK